MKKLEKLNLTYLATWIKLILINIRTDWILALGYIFGPSADSNWFHFHSSMHFLLHSTVLNKIQLRLGFFISFKVLFWPTIFSTAVVKYKKNIPTCVRQRGRTNYTKYVKYVFWNIIRRDMNSYFSIYKTSYFVILIIL